MVANWACLTLSKAEHLNQFEDALVQAIQQHSSLGVKQSAVATLCELEAATSETLKALEEATQSTDPRLRRLAERTLGKLSGRSPST